MSPQVVDTSHVDPPNAPDLQAGGGAAQPKKRKGKKSHNTTGVMLPVPDPVNETLVGSRAPRERKARNREDNDDGYVFSALIEPCLTLCQVAASHRTQRQAGAGDIRGEAKTSAFGRREDYVQEGAASVAQPMDRLSCTVTDERWRACGAESPNARVNFRPVRDRDRRWRALRTRA